MRAAAFLLLPLALWGVSVESLSRKAAAEHPEVVAAQQRLERALVQARLSGRWENPMIELELSDMMTSDPFNRSLPGQMSAVSLAQTIPAWGKTGHEKKMAEADAKAAAANLDAVKRSVIRETKMAAYNLEAARRQKAIWEKNRLLAQELVRIAGVYQSTARGDHLGLARAELLYESLSLRISNAEAALGAWQARLENLTGLPVERVELTLEPAGTLPLLETLRAQAAENNPRLREARAMAEAGQSGAALASAARMPDVTLRLGYASVVENEDYLFVRLEAPLLVKGSEKLAHQSARIAAQGAGAQAAGAQRAVNEGLMSAWSAAREAKNRYTLVEQKMLPQARHVFELAKARYESGGAGLNETYMALQEILELELMAVNEALMWHENRLMIEELAGEGL